MQLALIKGVKGAVKRWLPVVCFMVLPPVLMVSVTACSVAQPPSVVAQKGDFSVSVQANGELASSDTAYLSPPGIKRMWRYKLTFMLPEGAQVKKDQLVARFDSNDIADKLKQKQDSLITVSKELENLVLQQRKEKEDLKVQLALRQVNLRKARRKAGQLDVGTAQIEIRKLQLDLNIAQHDLVLYQAKVKQLDSDSVLDLSIKQRAQQSLQLEVDRLKRDLQRLSIKAPKAGIFVYGSNFEGDKFTVGDTVHSGQHFAEIPSLAKMVVKAKVSERYLGKINIGMAVEVTLDADPAVKYHGQLSTLGAVIQQKAKNSPEKIIEARITIVDPDHTVMRPGMIARIAIVVDTHKDVIVLPSRAVSHSNGDAWVQVPTWFGSKSRPVEVLAFDQHNTALSRGVAVGEEILL